MQSSHKRCSTITKIVLQGVIVLFACSAHAGIYCVGSVSNIFSNSAGKLYFKAGFRNDYVGVCNVQTALNGISPEQCKSWYALLLSAQLSGQVVSLSYPSATSSCSAVGVYDSAPVPFYVMLGDTFQ
jgi:hypothetical protein